MGQVGDTFVSQDFKSGDNHLMRVVGWANRFDVYLQPLSLHPTASTAGLHPSNGEVFAVGEDDGARRVGRVVNAERAQRNYAHCFIGEKPTRRSFSRDFCALSATDFSAAFLSQLRTSLACLPPVLLPLVLAYAVLTPAPPSDALDSSDPLDFTSIESGFIMGFIHGRLALRSCHQTLLFAEVLDSPALLVH
jgi:hypothetical protein